MEVKLNSKVEFKGTKDGIVLLIKPFDNFDGVLSDIKERLNQSAQFFSGATIIGVEGYLGDEKNRYDLYRLLVEVYHMEVKSLDAIMKMHVSQESDEIVMEADDLQLISNEKKDRPKEIDYNAYDTKIVHQTLRSGTNISYDGNILVIGDVNPGAELSAGGHVIVMGKLRGMVHAGKYGYKDAYVIASKLLPTQIRIANIIARAPEGENMDDLKPEIAHLKSGKMSIEEL